MATFRKLFRAPYAVPNDLQWTPAGLWIADQITDRVARIDIDSPNEYGVTQYHFDIPTESSNTSGLAWGEESLWLGANGASTLWRPARATDAAAGMGEVLRVDPATGATLARHSLPNGGGVHGVEYDAYDPGHLWVTTLRDQTLTKMRTSDWTVQHILPLPHERAHGVVRVPDGIWVVHTATRVIVKLDPQNGQVLGSIEVPRSEPEPHGLSLYGDDLIYCDATSGWVVQIS
jgi:streptogramin lyase